MNTISIALLKVKQRVTIQFERVIRLNLNLISRSCIRNIKTFVVAVVSFVPFEVRTSYNNYITNSTHVQARLRCTSYTNDIQVVGNSKKCFILFIKASWNEFVTFIYKDNMCCEIHQFYRKPLLNNTTLQ